MTYPVCIAASAATLVFGGPASPALQSLRPDNKIVEQKDAPVQVTAYRTDARNKIRTLRTEDLEENGGH